MLTKSLTTIIASLLLVSQYGSAQTTNITGPAGSGQFGQYVFLLTNGNYVVTDQHYDEGATQDVGAVYLYNGSTHALISTLKGSSTNDRVGNWVQTLSNGNFVIHSQFWDNGSITDAGASTWVNGVTGLSGVVNSSNSLVGSFDNQIVGNQRAMLLPNGNYLLYTARWPDVGNFKGAVTWVNGTTGLSGPITSSNSLTGDINLSVSLPAALTNGNFVFAFPSWNSGAGAVLWCNGTTGRVGNANSIINSTIAFVGSSSLDRVGSGGIVPLTNGNYVVNSCFWGDGVNGEVGAVTWCDGSAGRIGTLNSSNSFFGVTDLDLVYAKIFPLPNGNFVLNCPLFDDGVNVDVGSVTFFNGSGVMTGLLSSSNSLIGSTAGDIDFNYEGIFPLSNDNYVIVNPFWDNGSIVDAGAVTLANGITGITGTISSSNSLVGTSAGDHLGWGGDGASYWGVTALTNGNYVVTSPFWDNGAIADAGAATYCSGIVGLTGAVTAANSLVGSTINDQVGFSFAQGLTNGNYVVTSPFWDNGTIIDAGAVTWGNGFTGITGTVSSFNSLTGSTAGDSIGLSFNDVPESRILSNGNYVVTSPFWDNGLVSNAGALTWCNGTTGRTGAVTAANSITGNSPDDLVGNGQLLPLDNGHYIFHSMNFDGPNANSGAITFLNGATGLSGSINHCNSVLGTAAEGGMGLRGIYNSVYDYMIVNRPSDNIVSIFDPTGMLLTSSADVQSNDINGVNTAVPVINSSGCTIIATITATGANPVTGPVTTNVWIEPSVPMYGGQPYVARHYEMTPTNNPGTSTARITLYFTQDEFDDFNSHPSSVIDLPTGPNDATGINKIRIAKFSGTSSNGTGLAATYPGTPDEIDPVDADIIWNSDLARWEVTFDVSGFSGFFIQTSFTTIPLSLLEFKGRVLFNDAALTWKTAVEINASSFDIERSIDGRNFIKVAALNAYNLPGTQTYNYLDENIVSLGVQVIYYRLKQIDIDQRFTYSGIVALPVPVVDDVARLYPNPVIKKANIEMSVTKPQLLSGRVLDNTGRVVQLLQWSLLPGNNILNFDVMNLSKGIYFLELKGMTINQGNKFIKK